MGYLTYNFHSSLSIVCLCCYSLSGLLVDIGYIFDVLLLFLYADAQLYNFMKHISVLLYEINQLSRELFSLNL